MKCQYAGGLALALAVIAIGAAACTVFTAEQSDASPASWISGDCSVTLCDDGTLTVTAGDGTGGVMADYASPTEVPWASDMLSVQKISISDGVTHLGSYAFSGSSNLRSMAIPASVGTPDSTVFDGLALETPRGTKVAADCIAGHTFSGFGDKVLYQTSGETGDCTWVYDITTKTVTISGKGRMADYSILSHAPWGEDVAFVVINEGVTSIGNAAFEYCSSITSVYIPSTVTSIGQSAFLDCRALSGVGGCAGLMSIGEAAFASCTSIRNIDLPDSVAYMGADSFANCTMLTEFTVPASVTTLEEETFYGCTGILFVTVSEGITAIGPRAFCGCGSMTLFEIPSTVTIIDWAAFKNCTSLQSIRIPSSVTAIEESAFNGCSALRSVEFADDSGLKTLGVCAFESCTALTSVKIPSKVTDIGRGAFAYCESLADVTIPSSVENIDELAFAGLTIRLLNGTDAEICAENLAGSSLSGRGDKVLYLTSGVTGDCSWTYDLPTGALTVSGSGAICDYSRGSPAPWGTDVSSLTVGKGVTRVGDCAFMGCADIWKISLPSSVTAIGGQAFSGCSSIAYLDIPSSVMSIGESAFGDMVFKVDGSLVDADAASLAGHVFRMGADGAMESGTNGTDGQTSDDWMVPVLAVCVAVTIIIASCISFVFSRKD